MGRALMQHVESICPTDKLFTSTNQSNISMQELCRSSGYVASGVVENLDEGDLSCSSSRECEDMAHPLHKWERGLT